MRMRTEAAVVVAFLAMSALAGCAKPKTLEQRANEVIRTLQGRYSEVDTSKAAPDLPIPKNPPKEVDVAKVRAESAQIQSLGIEEIVRGSGPELKVGKYATVHYVGTLPDGSIFDMSYKGQGMPFTFLYDPNAPLESRVIEGWYAGLKGMRVGGRRRLVIPASMAYGANPPPGSNIPANAALLFDIELLFVGETP